MVDIKVVAVASLPDVGKGEEEVQEDRVTAVSV